MKHVIDDSGFGMVDIPNPLPTWTFVTDAPLTREIDVSDGNTKIRGFATMFRLYKDKDGSTRLQVKQDGQWVTVPTVNWYDECIEQL